MSGEDKAPGWRGLHRVIVWSTAISLGSMSAILYSIKQVNPTLQLKVTFGSLAVFLAAAGVGGIFARLMLSEGSALTATGVNGATRRRKRTRLISMIILAVVLNVGMLASFAFGLKGIANEKLLEVVIGTVLALVVLAIIALVFWRVTRFLERDSRRDRRGPDREA